MKGIRPITNSFKRIPDEFKNQVQIRSNLVREYLTRQFRLNTIIILPVSSSRVDMAIKQVSIKIRAQFKT